MEWVAQIRRRYGQQRRIDDTGRDDEHPAVVVVPLNRSVVTVDVTEYAAKPNEYQILVGHWYVQLEYHPTHIFPIDVVANCS